MKKCHILVYLLVFVAFCVQRVGSEIPERISDLYRNAYGSFLNEDLDKLAFDRNIEKLLIEISSHAEQEEVLYWT